MNAAWSQLVFATLLLLQASQAYGLVVGQTDDFEDGTTMQWAASGFGAVNPNPPANVSGGGPAGAADNYLLLNSRGGIGPSSRLTAFNFFGQWSGDYLAAGIGSISADLRNFGSNDLHIRLLIASVDMAGTPTNIAITDSIFLPTATDWKNVSFSLNPNDLSVGLGSIIDALSNAAVLRIFDSESGVFPGTITVASLSVDNITAHAAPVPIPPAVVLFGTALLPLFRRRLKQKTYDQA